MSETGYAVGDLIEVVNGDERISTRVVKHPTDGTLHINPLCSSDPDRWTYVDHFRRSGWTITVIEKAKPPVVLPTERGFYLGYDALAEAPILVIVADDGVVHLPDAGKWQGVGSMLGNPERFAPFSRLAPVVEVLGKVREELTGSGYAENGTAILTAMRAGNHYGVTL